MPLTPPKKLTEEEKFQQAAAEGRKRALDDAVKAIPKNREDCDSTAALPSASSASTKEAIGPGDNGSAGVSDKTPASGKYFTPSGKKTVFRGSFFDRQDNLESRLNAQQYDIQQMKEMLSMVLDRLPSPAAPTVPAKLLFPSSPIGTESENRGTDDDDSQVFEESRFKRTSISEKEPESKKKADEKEEPESKESEIPEKKEEPNKTPESPKTGRKIRDLKEMLRLVPTYEGKGSDSLLQYIDMFEIYLKNAVKCSDYDAEVTFFLATGCLKGDAWAGMAC